MNNDSKDLKANHISKRVYHVIWALIDILIVIASYSIVFLTRTFVDVDEFYGGFHYILLAAALSSVFLHLSGTYRRIWHLSSGNEVVILIVPTVIVAVVMTIIDMLPEKRPLPLSVVWLGSLVSLTAFTTLRYQSRLISGLKWRWDVIWLGQLPKKKNPVNVLVVGAGKSGQLFIRHIHTLEDSYRQFNIIGFVDDDSSKHGRYIAGKPVIGDTQAIPRIVSAQEIDLIVLALHNISSPNFRRVVDICQQSEAQVKKLPDIFGPFTTLNIPTQLRDIRIEDLIGRPPVPFEDGIDLQSIKGKVILVTGAAGSIGSELCRQLVQCKPINLLLLDNNESGLFDIQKELEAAYPQLPVTQLLCDVTNLEAVTEVFRTHKPQIIFHAAAYKHVPLLEDHPREAIRNNVGGTLNVAKLSQMYHAERFMLISSDKAVNSTSVMGATKYICERVVYGLADMNPDAKTLMTAVRFGNVLGSRGSVVPLFERQIANGGPVTVTDPNVTRYFMSVSEAAYLVLQAACMATSKNLYMLEMGERVRVVELAEHMIRLHGLRPYKDIEIVFTGLRPGETLDEKLMIDGEMRYKTAHPYITAITPPSIDSPSFLERSKHLLNGQLSSNTHVLKALVLDLAHKTQESYKNEEPQKFA